jgi:LPXTG-site transpeptidase (sortase) family protein
MTKPSAAVFTMMLTLILITGLAAFSTPQDQQAAAAGFQPLAITLTPTPTDLPEPTPTPVEPPPTPTVPPPSPTPGEPFPSPTPPQTPTPTLDPTPAPTLPPTPTAAPQDDDEEEEPRQGPSLGIPATGAGPVDMLLRPGVLDLPLPSSYLGLQTFEDGDGTSVRRIAIPRLGIDQEIQTLKFTGNTWDINGLGGGIGWLESTSLPGLGSNTALAGHVSMIGPGEAPFRFLHWLSKGDEIIVETDLAIYVYQVQKQQIVAPEDVYIVLDSEEPQLTLVTCTGWDEEQQDFLLRRAVQARLIGVSPLFSDTGRSLK